MQVKVYIGTEQLTLMEEESIELTSSVLNIEDISSNTTDYTKTFVVPADENNNRIFKHYYNANVSDGFDARTTVKGFITLGGWNFRNGRFLLREIKMQKGVAISYTVNFWGELLSLKDLIGDKTLKDLDLTFFDHNYNSANILNGLKSSLFGGDLIYTLLAKKRYYYNSNTSDTTQTPTVSNIAYMPTGSNGVTWNDLKPSIRLIKIIEAIEVLIGFKFSRHFFDTNAFRGLFLWVNNDAVSRIGGSEIKINWNSGSSTNINFANDIGTFVIDNKPRRWYKFFIDIIASAGYENVPWTLRQYVSVEGAPYSVTWYRSGVGTMTGIEFSVRSDDNREKPFFVYWTIDSQQAFKFSSFNRQVRRDFYSEISHVDTFASEMSIASGFEMRANLPDIKIIDLLKGIASAFKLVIIPQGTDPIYINTVNSFYVEGEILDLSAEVNTDEIIVSRADILNPLKYDFEEPQSLLATTFFKQNQKQYGNEEATFRAENGDILQGEELSIKIPFEQVIYERLTDDNTALLTNVQYGAIIDEELRGVNLKTHLHYNIPQDLSVSPIGFINDAGAKQQINTPINTPFPCDSVEYPENVFLFSEEQSSWNGGIMTNTLYKLYHSDYINTIFDVQARRIDIKANLTPRLVLALSLNDVIKIKNDYYRINQYTIDLISGIARLNLYTSQQISIKNFSTVNTNVVFTGEAQTQGIYVTNLNPFSKSLIDTGFGTSWLTVTDTGNNILAFTVVENNIVDRTCDVLLTSLATSEQITFTVYQYKKV